MNSIKKIISTLFLALFFCSAVLAQTERVKNLPYVDMKWFHLGFHVGIHSQDMILVNNGNVANDGTVWFAEIPNYSPGFSVGVIGDLCLNPYFNLRLTPTIHFGDKKFKFKEETSEEVVVTNVRSNYLMIPIDVKYTALRLNNYRPYLLAGIYTAFDLGRKKGNPILLKGTDFGIEVGLGCDIYLPFFKLCPELKFCFGLVNLLEKNRPDLTDPNMMRYSAALSRAKSRMIVLSINFE